MSAPSVIRVEFTEEEMRLLRSAVESYVADFGHEESDVLRASLRLLAKLHEAARR